MSTIASIFAAVPIPQRLVGNVSVSKDGTVSIDYREPGMVKTSTKKFLSGDVVAYMEGEAGFVITISSDPITRMVGDMTVKDNKVILNSEAGKIVINRSDKAIVQYTEVDESSREAKAAARISKVKGVKVKKDKSEKKKNKDKKSKKDKAEKKGKKKKKNKE